MVVDGEETHRVREGDSGSALVQEGITPGAAA
jgi:hypothetical protein